MNRLYNLDYLRGLAASGIMIYHYTMWTQGKLSGDSAMGRLGIYGVSIFYILSGLTLFYVYHHKMKPSVADVADFFKKRIFRIYPLLWLVTIATILLSGKFPNYQKLFLNLTGLFGLYKWDKYFATGVWSIGNELVFYLFFPFFILFMNRSKALFCLMSAVILGLYLYFAFGVLDETKTLSDQWKEYTNPLNQVFLFLSGFLMGYLLKDLSIPNTINVLLLAAAVGLFIFYPTQGDQITLVTDAGRIVFTVCCILACLAFYKFSIPAPAFIHKPLSFLGETSYSIYLIHPIVYKIFDKLLFNPETGMLTLPAPLQVIMCVLVTLIMSHLTYEYFEKFFMKLGRNKKTPAPAAPLTSAQVKP